jgi:uncharacterized Rmd1/YagE family protein
LEKQVKGTLSQKESQAKLVKHVISIAVLKSKEVSAHHPQRHQWEALQKKYLQDLEKNEKVDGRRKEVLQFVGHTRVARFGPRPER